jgi:hypothetical protein
VQQSEETATDIVPAAKPNAFHTIMLGSIMQAGGTNASKSAKGVGVSEILTNLYRAKKLLNLTRGFQLRSLRPVTIQILGTNIKKYEATMDLVDCLWTEEERQLATTLVVGDDQHVMRLFQEMDGRVRQAMAVLSNKNGVNSRTQPYYAGVGNALNTRLVQDNASDLDTMRDKLLPWKPSWMEWYKGIPTDPDKHLPTDKTANEHFKDYVARTLNATTTKRKRV